MDARIAILALCAAGVGLLGVSNEARAFLVLSGSTVETSFTDLGAQGFGNAPRLLTVQATGNGTVEASQINRNPDGSLSSANFAGDSFGPRNDVVTPCCTDVFKVGSPSLSTLGWTSGADVKIGMNTGEASTSILLEDLVLKLYGPTNNLLGSFFLGPSSIDFSDTALALQQGNGNAVFTFVLDSAQQTQFTNLLGANPDLSTFHITMGAAFSAVKDGPESFVAVFGPGAVIPIPGALVLFASGLVGIAALNRRRRSRDVMETAAAA